MKKITVSRLALLASAVLAKAHGVALAQTVPTDGVVISGNVSIATPAPSTMVVTQTSQTGIIDWGSFNIGADSSVHFAQPGQTSATLNRVTGDTPSTLAGNLTATGHVLLVNPNGIAITTGAVIDTGAFTASTLDIADADFLSGRLVFKDGGRAGYISNAGTIRSAVGGSVALVGANVINEGVIEARLGRVALAAGEMVTLDLNGDGFLSVTLPAEDAMAFAGIPTGTNLHVPVSVLRRAMVDVVNVDALGAMSVSQAASGVITLGGAAPADGEGRLQVGGTIKAEGGTVSLATQGVTWLTGDVSVAGADAGAIDIASRNILSAGSLNADGQFAAGSVAVNASGRLVATAASDISADGATGGSVTLNADAGIFSSGSASATGDSGAGGAIQLTGPDITLIAATLDASGDAGGGAISVGFSGDRSNPGNLSTSVDIAPSTNLRADARQDGNGGVIGVWSNEFTNAFGSMSARGGLRRGNGGLIEASSRGRVTAGGLVDAGADNGARGTFLLDPKNIFIDDLTGIFPQYQLVSPTSSSGDGFGALFGGLANGNVALVASGDDFGATNAGAVFLYDSVTGALLSSLTGSSANDQIGSNGVAPLVNGNFVVVSRGWDNAAAIDAGAITWGSGTTGISGVVSASNSLVGSTTGDQVGLNGITTLSNGNYTVSSPTWDNGGAIDAGAVTWGSGATGVTGAVSGANSLVGSTTSDQVGSGGVTKFADGNYVVRSLNWDNGAATNAGAVTWGSGAAGVRGVVSSANSLVGSTTNDQVGNGAITTLTNGNYVVRSFNWDNGAAVNAGAVTWGSSAAGVTGVVSAANSLVGSTTNDQVGSLAITLLADGNFVVRVTGWDNGAAIDAGAVAWGSGTAGVSGVISSANSLVGSTTSALVSSSGVTALANGNYVVRSPNWYDGAPTGVGALTWGSGTTGVSGVVSSANSLVGSTTDDHVGLSDITQLANGNYVLLNRVWDNGAAIDAGAVTWGSGTTGVSGVVSAANSLVGSTANDMFGIGGITLLANGNYVVGNSDWDNGAVRDAGAATWGSGTTGVSGVISAANSLVGESFADFVGLNVTALANGNYVVTSPSWENGAVFNAGAATWGSGTAGISGVVSAANSLVGASDNDRVGLNGITALANGNYLVVSAGWGFDAGAVTWGSGLTGLTGVVSSSNSLVGSSINDQVGIHGITLLANGNYVVGSGNWDNGAETDVGAATWGSGTTGVTGLVSAANSLVGSATNDEVGGSGVFALTNGNYVVLSINWDDGATLNVGAATWGSGTAGVAGIISAANSLVGSSTSDAVGLNGITILADGNYVVNSPIWNNGVATRAGAVTWASGTAGVTGVLSAANSLVGSTANDEVGLAPLALLPNGTYIVRTVGWDNGAAVDAGAVTRGSNASGVFGVISSANSLVGDRASAGLGYVGFRENGDVFYGRALGGGGPGRVYLGLGLPNLLSFSRAQSQDLTVRSSFLTDTLNRGTDVRLQANNDITVNSAISVNNPGGDGGDLTLEAGRSIIVNADITTDNGDLNLLANAPLSSGVVNAYRDAGDAVINVAGDLNAGSGNVAITLADGAGKTNATSGDISLQNITANTISVANKGTTAGSDIIINPGVVLTASGSGRAIDIRAETGTFNNASGAGAFNLTGGGHYGVFSDTRANTTEGVTGYATFGNVADAAAFIAADPGGNYFAYREAITTALTVIANDFARNYGDANNLTYTITGFNPGDTAATVLTGAPTLSTTATNTSGVGTYTITISLGTLATSAAYTFTFVNGQATVTARPVTITADDLSRIYGNANPALTSTVTSGSLVNGDALTGALATSATTASNVGGYAVTQGTLSAGANYAVTFNAGVLTVTARPITITADDLSRIYGNDNPSLTSTITSGSLVNGDALSGALATSATTTSNVGGYAIGQGALSAGSNYALTFNAGVLTITPRPVTITAGDLSRIYGNANPALTSTITSGSLVNGDTLSGALVTSATTTSNVGGYAIGQGTLSAGSNYAVTFNAGVLTVTQRPVTIRADDLSRIYGNANPALTSTITSGSLVNGDTLSGALVTSATTTSNVGGYAIGQGTISAGANYAVTFNAGVLTVTPRPIAITADDLSRIYGNANPALTTHVTSGSLVNGDTLTGVAATSATTTSNVGGYAIGQGTLVAGSNYAVTFNAGVLTITPRAVTVTANNASKDRGQADPALTYSVNAGGLVGQDTLSGSLTRQSGEQVGTYAILVGTVGNPNYLVTFIGGQMEIRAIDTPLPPTLTQPDQTLPSEAVLALETALTGNAIGSGETQAGEDDDDLLSAIYGGGINIEDPSSDTEEGNSSGAGCDNASGGVCVAG